MGLIFLSDEDGEDMVAIPLTLPMVCNNHPTLFWTETETIVELVNVNFIIHMPMRSHKYDDSVKAVDTPKYKAPQTYLAMLIQDPYLKLWNMWPLDYINLFVDNFLGLSQGPAHWRFHLWRTLFWYQDKILCPLERDDAPHRKEVIYMKNLDKGDNTCSNLQVLIGWVIDTFNMVV